MTTAVLPRPAPTVAPPALTPPAPPATPGTAATAYQRVLHRAVLRELRLLAELASWVTTDDAARVAELTRHADLVARVLLQHHAVERERLWPALFRSLPSAAEERARRHVVAWTGRTSLLDNRLRDLTTVARQWAVTGAPPARDAFLRTCLRVADAVAGSTAAEEADLLPLLAEHLPAGEWTAVCRAAGTSLSGREQMLVLGLLLEDASAIDRARVLAGLSPAVRTAWRAVGRRDFRAAVARLRGAPPAL
ncbi:hemerythrin domain-containing protein [Blastococcus sp. SYSU DS0669]